MTVGSEWVITCKKIIYATGYETHQMIKDDIGKLNSTYACISEPFYEIPASVNDTNFWDTEDPYCYCRSTFDKRILTSGEDEMFVDPDIRDALIEEKESKLVEKFHHLIPGINFIPDFCWAGTFGVTKDKLPYVGAHPNFP